MRASSPRLRPLIPIAVAIFGLTAGLSCGEITPPPADDAVVSVTVVAKADSILKTTGDTVRFVATARDKAGRVVPDKHVTWSVADPALATVDDAGLVTSLVLNGATTVRAAVDGVIGTAPVTLKQLAVSIAVTPATAIFTSLGDTVRFTAVATDMKGNAMPIRTWASAVPSRVSIDSTGLATALANGAATVVVYAGSDVFARNTKAVPMTVSQVPVALRAGPTTYTFTSIGEQAQFRDTLFDARGNPVVGAKASAWTSTNGNAVVANGTGLATAKANGLATIVVSNSGLSTRIPVSLVQKQASFLKLGAPVGAVVQMTSPSRDANGNLFAFPEPPAWTSSDAAIAEITPEGVLTAKQTGSVTLTAAGGGITGSATFNVGSTLPDTVLMPTTLTRAGSPYLMTNHVTIASGVAMKVDPGVTVKVDGQRLIIVNGRLEAFGTSTDTIRFTSARAVPIPGDWLGIQFNTGSVGATLTADGNYVSGSGMSYVDIGYAWTVTYRSTAYLANSRVHDNVVAGVTVAGAGGVFRGNTIEDNASAGLSFDAGGSGGRVQRNVIRRNKHGGIQTARGITIEDNVIAQNEEGFYGAAIGISGGASTIRYNDVKSNVLHGPPHNGSAIGLFGGSATISNNNIEGNTCVPTGSNANAAPECSAVWFWSATGSVTSNNLGNSGPFEIFLDHPQGNIDAASNYWNTTSSSEITAKVMAFNTLFTASTSPFVTSRITPNGPRP